MASFEELRAENERLRDTMSHIHAAYMEMASFNVSLRDQISQNLYYDPPPGICYGIFPTCSVGTQTDFVRTENERTDQPFTIVVERHGGSMRENDETAEAIAGGEHEVTSSAQDIIERDTESAG